MVGKIYAGILVDRVHRVTGGLIDDEQRGFREDLRAMVRQFCEMCRRGLKVNAGKSKVMVMNREVGLECEVHVNRIHLEPISELKYLGCVLDESGTDGAGCSRKVASERRVAGVIRSLVNARDLQLECASLA